jgi:hypothetical protein
MRAPYLRRSAPNEINPRTSSVKLNFGNLFNRLDETSMEEVMKVDKKLGKMAPLFKYLNNERLMRFLSKLLDIPMIRRKVLGNMKKSLLKSLTSEAPAGSGEV